MQLTIPGISLQDLSQSPSNRGTLSNADKTLAQKTISVESQSPSNRGTLSNRDHNGYVQCTGCTRLNPLRIGALFPTKLILFNQEKLCSLNPLRIGALFPTQQLGRGSRLGRPVSIPFESGHSFQLMGGCLKTEGPNESQSPSNRGTLSNTTNWTQGTATDRGSQSPSNRGTLSNFSTDEVDVIGLDSLNPLRIGALFPTKLKLAADVKKNSLNPLRIGALFPTCTTVTCLRNSKPSQSPSNRGTLSNLFLSCDTHNAQHMSQSPSNRGTLSNPNSFVSVNGGPISSSQSPSNRGTLSNPAVSILQNPNHIIKRFRACPISPSLNTVHST